MTDDEKKEILKKIIGNPDFIQSFATFCDNAEKDNPNILTIAAWFFARGYMSCMEQQKKSKMTRPYKYET